MGLMIKVYNLMILQRTPFNVPFDLPTQVKNTMLTVTMFSGGARPLKRHLKREQLVMWISMVITASMITRYT